MYVKVVQTGEYWRGNGDQAWRRTVIAPRGRRARRRGQLIATSGKLASRKANFRHAKRDGGAHRRDWGQGRSELRGACVVTAGSILRAEHKQDTQPQPSEQSRPTYKELAPPPEHHTVRFMGARALKPLRPYNAVRAKNTKVIPSWRVRSRDLLPYVRG